MKNPTLLTSNGIRESLMNIVFHGECNVTDIQDAVEDSKTGAELVRKLNTLRPFDQFRLDRETKEYARLVSVDCWGNKHYFKAYK